jgi:hypoxanthine phosphoribosyltransferase
MGTIPSHFSLLYSAEAIQDAVNRIGAAITPWAESVWDQSHSDIIAVPVLRGGIFFFADIVRKVVPSVEIIPGRSWGYTVGQNATAADTVRLAIDEIPAKGRSILLVDDVCDSGRTLKAMTDTLLERGALEVRSAVLIHRIIHNPIYTPTWAGYEYTGPEWFVGYGMEDCERWRNLPGVYIIRQPV